MAAPSCIYSLHAVRLKYAINVQAIQEKIEGAVKNDMYVEETKNICIIRQNNVFQNKTDFKTFEELDFEETHSPA